MTARYLTTEQAAEKIQMSADYVARQCNAGAIKATRLGKTWRISEDALDAFMRPSVAPPTRVRTARQRRSAA